MDLAFQHEGEEHGLASWHPAHMPHQRTTPEVHNLETILSRELSHGVIEPQPDSLEDNHSKNINKQKNRGQAISGQISQQALNSDNGPIIQDTTHTAQEPTKPGGNQDPSIEMEPQEGFRMRDEAFDEADTEPEGKTQNKRVADPMLDGSQEIHSTPYLSQGQVSPDRLSSYSRTTSFPDVPVLPSHQQEASRQSVRSRSQALGAMEDNDTVQESGARKPLDDFILSTTLRTQDEPLDLLVEGNDSGLFTSTAVGQAEVTPFTQVIEEARFEEGIPLMHATSDSERLGNDTAARTTIEELAKSPSSISDNGSLGQDSDNVEELSFSPRKPLDRKTTNQVLDSLQYSPNSIGHDQQNLGAEPLSLPKVTESITKTATSMDTERGEELSWMDQPQDSSISAMWQAALDDDELLDEDDSPSDQFPEGNGTQPSSNSRNFNSDNRSISQEPSSLQAPCRSNEKIDGSAQVTPATKTNLPSSQNKYLPTITQGQGSIISTFAPNNTSETMAKQVSPANPGMGRSASTLSNLGQRPSQQLLNASAPVSARPNINQPAQSFSDKSKGGYTSPYDLPMDLTRSKKRTNLQQAQSTSQSQIKPQPPPPRSSSMFVKGSSPSDAPPARMNISGPSAAPPLVRPSSSNSKQEQGNSSFFEELPSVKPRPSSSLGKYVSQAPQYDQGPQNTAFRSELHNKPSFTQRPGSSGSSNASQGSQLLPAERLSPYANIPQQGPHPQVALPTKQRYSPAPVPQSQVPPPANRYSASPSAGSRPSQTSQNTLFQPRTSSPLASHSSSSVQQHDKISVPNEVQDRSGHSIHSAELSHKLPSSTTATASSRHQPQQKFDSSPEHHHPEQSAANVQALSSPDGSFEGSRPLSVNYANTASWDSNLSPEIPSVPMDSTRTSQQPNSRFQPQAQPAYNPNELSFMPPQRSQTQSPGAARYKPEPFSHGKDNYQRPASVNDGTSPTSSDLPSATFNPAPTRASRGSLSELDFIRPADGREHDHLERWKGCPIFSFGFGGTTIKSFPKRVPLYAAGHALPMIKCSPGEVRLQTERTLPLDEDLANFPGPLKSRSKKKEVLDWLQKRIASLEALSAPLPLSPIASESAKRRDERVMLWKVLRILVENDGILEGNEKAEIAVRTVLSPESVQDDRGETVDGTRNMHFPKIHGSNSSRTAPAPLDPEELEAMRRLLLQGEREKAVWHAVDRKMWPHAMVIASTLDKAIWKQVLHEFVRLEVRTFSENSEPLSALYEIFAGNWEESVDELVPPSARAGLQMVSKVSSGGPSKNALDGLDRWRETLTLMMSNRTPDDSNALVALGRLLSGYGRTSAAHMCFVFSRSPGLFGGPDDPQVSVALLGADHLQQPFDYGRDLDSILLTEIYDFARSVLASSAMLTVSPHLQAYRLYHAMVLTEHGYRSEAQQYCDAIMSTLKSTTKPSPYYHPQLVAALDELVDRLRQAPRDGVSWISKPMDKVSGSVWQRFNNFIAGDESDNVSISSTKGDPDAGPFARVNGGTPSISPNVSSNDLHGAYGSSAGAPMLLPATNAYGSRYVPGSQHALGGQYTPRSSLEQPSRSSHEFQRPLQNEPPRFPQPQQTHDFNQPRYASSAGPSPDQRQQLYKPINQQSQYASPPEDSLPTPPSQPDYLPTSSADDPPPSLSLHDSSNKDTTYCPPASPNDLPIPDNLATNSYEPPYNSYNPEIPSYEPSSTANFVQDYATSSSYDDQTSPKKDSLTNDRRDYNAIQAATNLEPEQSPGDKEATETAKKTAEADAQKSHELKSKKSWFSLPWLPGKKDADSLNQEPKAIKAKLGEDSSFYFDKELKRWVNKKDGANPPAVSATPPPPRGPPSRAVSGAGPPPPSNLSTPPVPALPSTIPAPIRLGSTPPVNVANSSTPQLPNPRSGTSTPIISSSPTPPLEGDSSATPPVGRNSSAPPPQPVAGKSNANNSIDDLIGEPQARKGGTIRKAKKARGYVDVMAK
ncbi:MAG: hypothetical protein Q9167_006972 [Letrouitia subvulpina]